MRASTWKVSWVAAAIAPVVLAMTATCAANAETGGDPSKRMGGKVLRDIAVTTGLNAATGWLRTFVEPRPQRETNAAADIRRDACSAGRIADTARWRRGVELPLRRRWSSNLP